MRRPWKRKPPPAATGDGSISDLLGGVIEADDNKAHKHPQADRRSKDHIRPSPRAIRRAVAAFAPFGRKGGAG
jgi:hypothetical protein